MRKKRCLLAGIWFFSIVFGFLPVRLGSLPVWVDHLTDREKSLEVKQQEFNARADKINLPFIENQGQADERVSYYANIFSGTLFVTNQDLTYTVIKGGSSRDLPGTPLRQKINKGDNDKTLSFKEVFLDEDNAPLSFSAKGLERSLARVSYFRGNDPNKWRSDIPTYDLVSLGEIYPDIEIRLKARGKNVEKLFYLNPGADPQDIRIKLAGIKDAHISKEGELILETEPGDLKMSRPVAYQEIDRERYLVDVSYRVLDNVYGFEICGDYDRTRALIIDPLLGSTFLGGSSTDYGYSLALDSSNNVYVTGMTYSSNFPTTSGAYNEVNNGGGDVFVLKLNSSLTSLLASTFLGGSDDDHGYSLALDSFNNVYVTGRASSSNFPATSGAYDESYNGGADVFVLKLNSSLTSLLASTFLGGSGLNDRGSSLALDSSNNVYVTGFTDSSNFPTISGACDESYNGGDWGGDAFVCKLNSSLTSLLASTFLGGSNDDGGLSLALDSSNNVYVTGYTDSSDFPTTSGAYDGSYNGGNNDVFVSKLNSSLSTLSASTFLGGSGYDHDPSLALDSSNNVYVTGFTDSSNFPTTSGAYDETHNGSWDVFVLKLNSSLTSLLASTFLGGSNGDQCNSLALDSSNNVYITGNTGSSNFPTPGGYDTTHNGGYDVFVSKLDKNLSVIIPLIANAGADVTVYPGDWCATTLNGSATGGTPPYTYSWSPTTGLDNPNTASSLACPDTTTTYTLTVVDANGYGAQDQATVYLLDGWIYPMNTYWHDARTQVICLSSEIGHACRITSLALDVTTVPGQTMEAWTIRMKHTPLSSYPDSPEWEGSGWTTVYQSNESITSTGWNTFVFSTPFDFDYNDSGSDNLLVDFSFNNSSYTSSGLCRYSTPGGNRSIYYCSDSEHGDPLTWSGTNPLPSSIDNVPNVRFTVEELSTIIADFVASPTTGCAPLTVTFSDLSTGNVLDWWWDFGDGMASSASNPTHTYNTQAPTPSPCLSRIGILLALTQRQTTSPLIIVYPSLSFTNPQTPGVELTA